MQKKILAALVAAIMALVLALPAFAYGASGTKHATPSGYNDHDYQKMAAFLDIETTVTYMGFTMTKHNYEWLQMIDSGFSMQDPSTWHVSYNGTVQFYTTWTSVGGEYRLQVVWANPSVTSFSGYSSGDLDLSGCTELTEFTFNVFRLGALDVSGCPKLASVACRDNNNLSSINLSGCPLLASLDLTGCLLTMIDLTDSPLMPFERISANGQGTVYYANGTAYAAPNSGKQFLGWYSEGGAFISSAQALAASSTEQVRVSARFTGASVTVTPGDADGNGTVDVMDALTVLRASMQLVPMTDQITSACDVNGDGSVNVLDALMILRYSMQLLPTL